MTSEGSLVRWLDTWAVVTAPAEIDVSNSQQFGEQLLSVISDGPSMLVVDMRPTTFCDSSGAHELVKVHKQAGAADVGMRLVITASAVLRVFELLGLNDLFDVQSDFPSAYSPDCPALPRPPREQC